jgi:hypothetical protein
LYIFWGKQKLRTSNAYGPQPNWVFGVSQDASLAYNTFIGRADGYLLNRLLHSAEISIVPRWQLIKRGIRERQLFDNGKNLFYQDSVGFLPAIKPEYQFCRLN